MSYCRECGAYIPDGENRCLACGWTEKTASGAQTQREQKREKKAENSAENHKNNNNCRRNYSYGGREDRRGADRYYSASDASTPRQNYARDYSADAKKNRGLACLCYLGPLFILSWLLKPDSKFVKYHINQGLLLFLCWIVIGVFDFVPFMSLANIVAFVFMIMGIVNASEGKRKPLPIIGDITLIK